jgi:hypothetical protein
MSAKTKQKKSLKVIQQKIVLIFSNNETTGFTLLSLKFHNV